MGNRAVITTNKNLNETGIYLHWNGGRDSVEAFLAYCDLKHYRKPENDSYGYAMLINVITNYFGSGLSCDVGNCQHLDCANGDNGVYIIKDWRIVGRLYSYGEEYEYDFIAMINDIDSKQPERMQLTREERERIPEVYKDVVKYRRKNGQPRDGKGRFRKV